MFRLYDLTVKNKEDVKKLTDAIGAYAAQENLRNLNNQTSKIEGLHPNEVTPLHIELEKLKITKSDNGLTHVKSMGFFDAQTTPVNIGDYYRFQITNNTATNFYVAVFWIGSGGSIGLYSPTNTGELIIPGKSLVTIPPLQAGPPTGLETYKVIATSIPGVDFHFLVQPGTAGKSIAGKDLVSPLAWFISQTTNQDTKDPIPASNVSVGDWLTAQTNIYIQGQ